MQINPNKLNAGEIELIQWQYKGDMGHFRNAVWKAIQNADNGNLERLRLGFPDQVDAYLRYIGEDGYWQDVLLRSGLVVSRPEEPAEDQSQPEERQDYDH